nr:omptin family outer membrane protease [Pragia fontium]
MTMRKLNIIVPIITIPFAFSALANSVYFTPEKISIGLSMGSLSGEAKERVYDPDEGGRKISQLNWKYKNAAIIKGNLEWDVMPWVSMGASGWTTLGSRSGHMNDYDWESPEQERWTDHSSHPNTKLNYANQFDVNLAGWILNEPNYRLGLIAGYQQSMFSWTAKGGSFNYENGTDIGEFEPGVSVIGYSQKFKLPYVGLTSRYRYEKYEVNGVFKFSNWGKATDNDEHYLRTTTFKEKVKNQKFYSFSADAGYYVTNNVKVLVEGSWSRMLNAKGDTSMNDYGEGEQGSEKDSAGIEHSNYMVTAGFKYMF